MVVPHDGHQVADAHGQLVRGPQVSGTGQPHAQHHLAQRRPALRHQQDEKRQCPSDSHSAQASTVFMVVVVVVVVDMVMMVMATVVVLS